MGLSAVRTRLEVMEPPSSALSAPKIALFSYGHVRGWIL